MNVCFFCGYPSTLLCDGSLAYLGTFSLKQVASPPKLFTCDRPLCRKCAVNKGHIHYNIPGKHKFDTMDYCLDCIKEGREHDPYKPNDALKRLRIVTEEQGKAIQKQRLAKAPDTTQGGNEK